jgi:hypothetical protein
MGPNVGVQLTKEVEKYIVLVIPCTTDLVLHTKPLFHNLDISFNSPMEVVAIG